MQTMTVEEFQASMKAQGVPFQDVKFVCPNCKTKQSANDLIKAGAGKDMDEVESVLAFSCIGRFDDKQGCDWTLGGLFRIHELEVIDPEGQKHPRFMPVEKR